MHVFVSRVDIGSTIGMRVHSFRYHPLSLTAFSHPFRILGLLVFLIEQRPAHHAVSTGIRSSTAKYKRRNVGLFPLGSFSPSKVLDTHSVRSLFYIIASVPCFLRAPNYSGGLCLISSGLTYVVPAKIGRA